jgi:hypothetical protein
MAFIQGAFLREELNNSEQRLDFLRLLITNNFDKSLKISKLVMKEFEQKLHVPAVKDNSLYYLKHFSTLHSKGVYGRNLGLCRRIVSPICYGESLCQDNEKELQWLKVNQLQKPAPRIIEVAEAYFQAILKYFKL